MINSLLRLLGVTDHPIQFMYTDFAVLVGMVYVYLPLMVLPLYASMEKLDFRLVEAAYDLYATRFQVLRKVILPLVKPGIIAGSILVFIPSLGAYVTPRVMGGGTNLMIGNLIELQFGQGRNWPLGASLSITLMVIVMIALLIYVRNAGRSGAASMASAVRPLRRQTADRLRDGRHDLLLPALSADRHACRLRLQRQRFGGDLGRFLAALVRVGWNNEPGDRRVDPLLPDRDRPRHCLPPSPRRWPRSPRPGPNPIAASPSNTPSSTSR